MPRVVKEIQSRTEESTSNLKRSDVSKEMDAFIRKAAVIFPGAEIFIDGKWRSIRTDVKSK